ncbi:vanadium-dependent haloperoxidase [Rhodoferax mekongensis]|uniref:Vanadium-dependent haloperoxidase n=1 Tax=Rhodoferax mekongensis TaxID=3068341 RepID=A0ABZ0AVZ3_9BURK|nr:vanadium-dependent haloperoxidase [Rhodoferax sp. TBRC 17307]WNO03773.1 vanadium-dependent haloperoxidase [Rhodoferax sp. TBRC 17307]
MKVRTFVLATAASFATLLSPISVAQPAQVVVAKPANSYSSGVVYDWFFLAFQLIQQTPGFSPPIAARALGYMGLTLYESVVPGMPGYQSLAGQLNELSSLPWAQPDEPLHWPTVANASMATMTRMMFSNASAENKARIDTLERSLPLKYTQDFDPNSVTAEMTNRSETFGKLMAMAIMTWARTDGGHEAWGPIRRHQQNYVPPSGTGKWSATPPAFAAPLLPYWGKNRPFVMKTADDCPAPTPPAYSEEPGSAFYKDGMEVYQISRAATQEQRQFALYWADDAGKTPTPAGHWAYVTNDLLRNNKADLGTAAEVFARLNMAMSDAFVAAWNTKYKLNVLRPVTYVQLVIDSNWTPSLMPTPPFPDYPSGHSVQSSAAAAVLGKMFGANTAFVDNTHNDRGWGPRTFKSFKAAADEAAASRIFAGIHYRFASEGGKPQGQCAADKVLALKFRR